MRKTHLWVVGGTGAVQVASDLSPQVGNDDELFENVLGQNVRVSGFLDVIGRYINVISTQVQVSGSDGPDSPLSL